MLHDDELEQCWVRILAKIYRAVPWRQMAKNRYPYDVFESRLAVGRYERDVVRIISKTCNLLGAGLPSFDLDDIKTLREHNKEAVALFRDRYKLLALLAAKYETKGEV